MTKFRVHLISTLALLSCPSLVQAQESGLSTSTVQSTPWTKSRAVGEGAGIKTGSVEWHPGISGEFGFDSNYYQRASSAIEETNFGPVVPTLRFRVTPQLSLRTLDRSQEDGKASSNALPPAFMFDVSSAVSYNEFISLDGDYSGEMSALRNIQGGANAGIAILSRRVWSGNVQGGYLYTAEPSNQGGLGGMFDRHTIDAGADIVWAPGGGSFRWSLLDYGARFTLFDEGAFGSLNNVNHSFRSHGMWKFLPKTSVLYDGKVQIIRYPREGLNDGEILSGELGLNGLLTKKLALLVKGGWAASFYKNDNGVARNFNDFIGKAEAKWFFSPEGRLKEGDVDVGASALALGVLRDFNDSYLGDFYRRNRGYIQGSYLLAGNIVTTLEGGVSLLSYPDSFSTSGIQQGFNETRIDVQAFGEYRPTPTVGINLQLRYDQNASTVLNFQQFQDDLSFNRFRAMLGARWFL